MDAPAPATAVKRRACVNCTAAKAKCNSRSDGICERCARNGKLCVYQDMPERKRRSQQPGHALSESRWALHDALQHNDGYVYLIDRLQAARGAREQSRRPRFTALRARWTECGTNRRIVPRVYHRFFYTPWYMVFGAYLDRWSVPRFAE